MAQACYQGFTRAFPGFAFSLPRIAWDCPTYVYPVPLSALHHAEKQGHGYLERVVVFNL